jgi:hypothetical protein
LFSADLVWDQVCQVAQCSLEVDIRYRSGETVLALTSSIVGLWCLDEIFMFQGDKKVVQSFPV